MTPRQFKCDNCGQNYIAYVGENGFDCMHGHLCNWVPTIAMTPLTKEEIDAYEQFMHLACDVPLQVSIHRLFYTARLGAEFVKQTQALDKPGKEA